MPMTMTQRIMARAAGLESVQAGELISCALDLVFANDITAPVAIDEFEKMGAQKVFDPARVALIPDHFTPNKDIAAAKLAQKTRAFAVRQGCRYFEVGCMGIEHALLPEQGLIAPGEAVIGADSHTCTHGALAAFATGVGSTDMAAGMATGRGWFKVPQAIRVVFSGQKAPHVTGKDIILHLIGLIGVDGARYQSLEFGGAIQGLTMDDRFTICNMAVEAGAKNGIFPVDVVTRGYIAAHGGRYGQAVEAEPGAEYARTVEIDLAQVPLTIAFPHQPGNTRSVRQAWDMGLAIDQVVIGSCTNGRISDMAAAAAVLAGRRVHQRVRCIIIPATQAVWLECVRRGYMETFIAAGAAVSTPTCGPCLGGHMGVLAPHERCVATTNRNFVGRMGDVTSEVYLAGPAVAAASAVAGRIAGPDAI